MLETVNSAFKAEKRKAADEALICESVMDVEEVLPGSDDDIDDIIDSDSIPDDVYQKIDAALDKVIGDGIEDDDIEDMLDGEEDNGDAVDSVTVAIDEAVEALLEGEQADAYKEKKQAEKDDEYLRSTGHAQRRWDAKESDRVKKNGSNRTSKEEMDKMNTSPRFRETQKDFDDDKHGRGMRDNLEARNAMDRHERRHGAKNESADILDAIDEACAECEKFWADDETIGHPNTDIRKGSCKGVDCSDEHDQPDFDPEDYDL